VVAVSSKNGTLFGDYEGGVLKFPITFLVNFTPTNLFEPGGRIEVAGYDGTLLIKEQTVQLTPVKNNTSNAFVHRSEVSTFSMHYLGST
jgi:hypothetical protein